MSVQYVLRNEQSLIIYELVVDVSLLCPSNACPIAVVFDFLQAEGCGKRLAKAAPSLQYEVVLERQLC